MRMEKDSHLSACVSVALQHISKSPWSWSRNPAEWEGFCVQFNRSCKELVPEVLAKLVLLTFVVPMWWGGGTHRWLPSPPQQHLMFQF